MSEVTEDSLTQAIYELTRGERKTIYYIEGHGEPDLHSSAAEGLAGLLAAARESGLELQGLIPAGLTVLPVNTATVMVVAGQAELTPSEQQLLAQYLKSGGRVWLLQDPQSATSVAALAREVGIEIGQNVVIDPSQRFQGADLWQVAANSFDFHAITRDLGRDKVVVFLVAATVTPPQAVSAAENYTVLVSSSKNAWAETDLERLFSARPQATLDSYEKRGPLPLAVAYSQKLTESAGQQEGQAALESRVVVVGDTEWLRNSGLNVYSNKELALNTLSWLAGSEASLGLRPRSLTLMVKPVPQDWVRATRLVTICLIELLVLLGLLVWWRRKNAVSRSTRS